VIGRRIASSVLLSSTGAFLDVKRNAICIGGTWHCVHARSLSAVIRTSASGRFLNLVDLVNHLEQEKAAGRSGQLCEKLLRYDLIINELGYIPSNSASLAALQALRTHVAPDHDQSRVRPLATSDDRHARRCDRLCSAMWGSAPLVSAPSARNIRAPKRGHPCKRKGRSWKRFDSRSGRKKACGAVEHKKATKQGRKRQTGKKYSRS
jgi:hypothetical protein